MGSAATKSLNTSVIFNTFPLFCPAVTAQIAPCHILMFENDQLRRVPEWQNLTTADLIWSILICKTTIINSPTPSELEINTREDKHSENNDSTTFPQFSCPNLKMGCKWEGSQEEEHLKKHCQFEQGNCSHCEKRFLRKDLEPHEMLVCIERPAACSKNCGWIGRKAGLNGHLETCPGLYILSWI